MSKKKSSLTMRLKDNMAAPSRPNSSFPPHPEATSTARTALPGRRIDTAVVASAPQAPPAGRTSTATIFFVHDRGPQGLFPPLPVGSMTDPLLSSRTQPTSVGILMRTNARPSKPPLPLAAPPPVMAPSNTPPHPDLSPSAVFLVRWSPPLSPRLDLSPFFGMLWGLRKEVGSEPPPSLPNQQE